MLKSKPNLRSWEHLSWGSPLFSVKAIPRSPLHPNGGNEEGAEPAVRAEQEEQA